MKPPDFDPGAAPVTAARPRPARGIFRARRAPEPAPVVADTAAAAAFLDHVFGRDPTLEASFRLWDGSLWPDAIPRAATVELNHAGALRRMFQGGTELGLAESYLAGDFDVTGDLETACGLAERFDRRPTGWRARLKDYRMLQRLPGGHGPRAVRPTFAGAQGQRHSRRRDQAAVSFHYDVSNDFYGLWLDRGMVYSCAYFTDPDAPLDAAQEAKLRHLCRKLRLRPGQRLLDIGCGWGALAIHAARERGVTVTGVTLSTQQAELARQRVQAAGLETRVVIHQRDYRELHDAESYDAIVSVGMSEHVGTDQLPFYFSAVAQLLKPGGVLLNHAIGEGARPRHHRGPSFIDRHVFPDSAIPAVPAVAAAAEQAGFEVRDVENLREHYALTLRHWVRRLESHHAEALAFVDEATYRVWRLYMAGSARGFARGNLAIYQLLLSKPDITGAAHLPLTREDWYPGQADEVAG